MVSSAKGVLYAIGGHENRKVDGNLDVLGHLLHPKAKNKTILVVTSACQDGPEDFEDVYTPALKAVGFTNVKYAHIETREQAHHPYYINLAHEAGAALFSGGCQLTVRDRLQDTPFYNVIQQKYMEEEGFVYAGTSAGAMSMGQQVIKSGCDAGQARRKGIIETVSGFGLVQEFLIETHSRQRQRIFRTLQPVLESKGDLVGVHLDENTGVWLENGEMHVVGSGKMTLMDAKNVTSSNIDIAQPGDKLRAQGLAIYLLNAGDVYRPAERRIIPYTQQLKPQPGITA